MVFRLIDDAGSVTLDRENHPERIHLLPKNYKHFLIATIITTIVFLFALYISFTKSFLLVTGLIVVSAFLYVIFHRNKIIISLIPLLKYPILLWCLISLSYEVDAILICLSSFAIMLMYDLIDDEDEKKRKLVRNVIGITICSILVFQPWLKASLLVFTILPIILVFTLNETSYLKYLPVIYFPILSLISNLFL
jgi:hypothetical protein